MGDEGIAIIGAGCRFPGADNLDEFWRVLLNGENHVKDIPDTRWNNAAFFDEDKTAAGKIYVRKAGLLKNHDKWDNRLFGISDAEASRIDPQQRYVLECVHMALEDGGLTRKQLSGSRTGVIIGCMNDDYKAMANSDLSEISSYNATGTSASIISARVSYVYNLHGTCLTLDTACSSALVAVHLASQAIKTGDCDMMICGGVSSILSPDTFVALCKARLMSATGQCQSFCETADGYARGEGCGIVILKGLKAAVKDGNKIWATIKTGSNQDGCIAKPMTAPSGQQQLELLKHVYKSQHFNPLDIQYIEAHGTGTPRGDPTELNALGTFFSSTKKTSKPLLVGSVKSNIGHTESAAGVAGLLKVLLMMKHGKFVPSLHVTVDKSNVNKNINLSEHNLEISTAVQDWLTNKSGRRRHACLNSFGFGGSNTHLIITQEKKEESRGKGIETEMDNRFIPISGLDQDSLKLNLLQFHDDLEKCDAESLDDIAHSAFLNRDIFPYRTLVYGKDRKDVQKECKNRVERVTEINPKGKCKIVFVYCGVGTTWTGMGQEFMEQNDVFRKTINEIDRFLEPLTKWKISEKLEKETWYDDPFLNHISIFCVQVALTELWRSFGVDSDTVVGQSVGEVAASYAANLLSLEEAVSVIYHRTKVLSQHSQGLMAVVGNVDVNRVENICITNGDQVCVAVYSSPIACTLSGNKKDLDQVLATIKQQFKNAYIRELKVQCAYHSPLLDSCMSEIKNKIDAAIKTQNAERCSKVQMISTVSGEPISRNELITGFYWAQNIRRPVKFMQGIKQALDKDVYNIFVEIGPRPVLKIHIPKILEDTGIGRTIPSMLVKKELRCFHESLSELFEVGYDINVFMPNVSQAYQLTEIPRYSFNRRGHLFIPNISRDHLAGLSNITDNNHMFVQTSRRLNDSYYKICIDEVSTPFVYEHFLSDINVVPGATYVEAGLHIGIELMKRPADHLSIAFRFSKTFTPTKGRQHLLPVHVDSKTSHKIDFSVLNDGNVLAMGSVTGGKTGIRNCFDINLLKAHCTKSVTRAECYSALEALSFRYGDSLSLIQEAWLSHSEKKCLARIQLPHNFCVEELTKTHFHPTVIDSVFQMFGLIVKSLGQLAVPEGVGSVRLLKPIEPVMYGYAEETRKTVSSSHYNSVLLSTNGFVIAEIENFHVRILAENQNRQDQFHSYCLNWLEMSDFPESDGECPRSITVFSEKPNAAWLKELGHAAQVIPKQILEYTCMSKLPISSNENTVLLYHAFGEEEICGTVGGNSILTSAFKRFSDLKKLIKFQQYSKIDLPIVVITENTQLCTDRKTMNCMGSELWGMVRSVVHEGSIKNIKLVDIDRNDVDVETLVKLVFTSSETNVEFALHGSKLFRPKLYPVYRPDISRRTVPVADSDIFTVCSSRSSEIIDPYLILSLNDSETTSDTIEVVLDSFTCHNNSLYVCTTSDTNKRNSLLDCKETDYQIIVLEGKGQIAQSQADVLFLYPVKAGNIVRIPEKHIVNRKDCPTDADGVLILANLLLHISSNIEDKSDVVIMNQSNEVDIGHILFSKLMIQKGCKTQFCTTNELNIEGHYFNEDTIVITFVSSVEILKLISTTFPYLKRIVSLNMFFPDQLKIWVMQNLPSIQMTILSTAELLTTDSIGAAMPMVKEYLQNLTDSCMNGTNQFLLELPMPHFRIKDIIKTRTLQCFSNETHLFRSQACYIIVGGLTGLGWELLQMMAEMGAGILVPLSRRKPSNEIDCKIKEIEERRFCRIWPMQADVSDLTSIERTFTNISERFPNQPIKGIFHGAGVTADAILDNLDERQIYSVLKPKVLGVWNLHLATLNLPLDYFVIHSSIVSIIGNPGQCNYAAANSFLDSFALYRRSKGLPAQSINWGALAVGMAVEKSEIKAQLSRKGFNALPIEQIREYFVESMLNGITNVVYADVDWEKLLSVTTFSMQAHKFSDFQGVRPNTSDAKKEKQIHIDDIHKLDIGEKTRKVKTLLREIIDETFLTQDGEFADETPFTDLGIDSMAVTSLSNTIYETFGCQVSIVSLLSETATLATTTELIIRNISKSTRSFVPETIASDEFQKAFSSRVITFMQKDFLHSYMQNRKDPFYQTVFDVEITGIKLSVNKWKLIMRHVIKLNPGLSQVYHFSNDGNFSVESKANNNLDVSVTEIPFTVFSAGQVKDIRISLNGDINGVLPVSSIITETEYNTILRIIVHKLVIDMKGLSILGNDIKETTFSVINNTDLPSERPNLDIPTLVKNSVLPRMKDLTVFWEEYLNRDIKPVTLGSSLQKVDSNYYCESFVEVPKEKVLTIRRYIASVGLTLYEFIMSLYQLYLYIGSKCSTVIVGTAADMRLHVPELNNTVTRCTNYIPVIAEIQEQITLNEFIKANSKKLSITTKNGAYPSSLILKMFQSSEARKNAFRHLLAMNDMSLINKLVEDDVKDRVIIKKIWQAPNNRETSFFVKYDLTKAWITFLVGYNSKLCGHLGQAFPEKILQLAEEVICCGNKTIAGVRDSIFGPQGVTQSVTIDKKHTEATRILKDMPLTNSNSISKTDTTPRSLEYTTGNEVDIIIGKGTNIDTGQNKLLANEYHPVIKSTSNRTDSRHLTSRHKEILLTGRFEKQTSNGWDHTVQVILCIVDERQVLIEWGKERRMRKRTHRVLDLTRTESVELMQINGLHSIIISLGDRKLVFKTQDIQQADLWMNSIKRSIRGLQHNTKM